MPFASYRTIKKAEQRVQNLANDGGNLLFIHYSCEALNDKEDGSSPRITSIAVRREVDGVTHSFSIHKAAEIRRLSVSDIVPYYPELEREMLREFFEFCKENKEKHYVHWNMRNITYGFPALEHRFRVLGGEPFCVDDSRKHDLGIICIDIYGSDYIEHPRLENLIRLNGFNVQDYISGRDEPILFNEGKFVTLHKSTLRKVDLLAEIFRLVATDKLKTKTGWWERRGGKITGMWAWCSENQSILFFVSLFSLILSVVFFVYS